MSAALKQRIYVEVSGVGATREMTNTGTDSTAPTEIGAGYTLATTTSDQLDLGGSTVAGLRMAYILAEVGTLWVNPLTSAVLTAACRISAGNGMLFMYSSVNTCVPWIQGSAATDAYSYIFTAIAT